MPCGAVNQIDGYAGQLSPSMFSAIGGGENPPQVAIQYAALLVSFRAGGVAPRREVVNPYLVRT